MAKQNTKIIVKPFQQTSIFPELLDGFAHSQKITKNGLSKTMCGNLQMFPSCVNGVPRSGFG